MGDGCRINLSWVAGIGFVGEGWGWGTLTGAAGRTGRDPMVSTAGTPADTPCSWSGAPGGRSRQRRRPRARPAPTTR